jgi:hypothetical protein
MQHTSAKKMQRGVERDVLPLDRSLLMGVPPYVDAPVSIGFFFISLRIRE